MSDHWKDQPRVPSGNEEGGQWTDEAVGKTVSAAREGAGLGKEGYEKVGHVKTRRGEGDVYEVREFTGEDYMEGSYAIKLRGLEILATEFGSYASHNQMIQAVHPDKNVDDYVRAYVEDFGLSFYMTAAGVEVGEADWETKAIDNIYKALGQLDYRGFPKGVPVLIFRSHQDEEEYMDTETGDN